jgi:two-component system OmpR family response regulator
MPAVMDKQPHLLIVDDDHEIRDLLSRFMEQNGFRVSAVCGTAEAREKWEPGGFQLVLLDMVLPRETGLDLIRWLRARQDVPIVIVSVMGEESDRILHLELGADDYLTKPFNPRELLARIRAVLRRAAEARQGTGWPKRPGQMRRFEGWNLDTAQRRLMNANGVEVPLTPGEYDLLLALMDRPNCVLTRDMLLDVLPGRQAGPDDKAIDVAVSRLRWKLDDHGRALQIIKTVRGGGYLFAATTEAP